MALTDLVDSVLTPLTRARGGAEPFLDTLEGYFAAGDVAVVTARQLHLSVRTVTGSRRSPSPPDTTPPTPRNGSSSGRRPRRPAPELATSRLTTGQLACGDQFVFPTVGNLRPAIFAGAVSRLRSLASEELVQQRAPAQH